MFIAYIFTYQGVVSSCLRKKKREEALYLRENEGDENPTRCNGVQFSFVNPCNIAYIRSFRIYSSIVILFTQT